jgi:hypothetical protein
VLTKEDAGGGGSAHGHSQYETRGQRKAGRKVQSPQKIPEPSDVLVGVSMVWLMNPREV